MHRLRSRLTFPFAATLVAFAAYSLHSAVTSDPEMSLAAVRARNAASCFPDRTALIVGATAGIGRALALRLAEADYAVVAVGRDEARGSQLVKEMGERGSRRGGHEFLRCDASLISSVRACAREVAARRPRIDALVLTQGIASIDGRNETAEGLDTKLSLHYFSRVAFVQSLLPQLRAAPSPRVLCVLSAGVHGSYAHCADDFELKEHFSLKNAADAAGFYTDAALDSLSREPENAKVTFIHAAPGFVATSWGTELPSFARGLVRCLQYFAMPPEDCAEFLADPLLADREKGGLVLVGAKGAAAAVHKRHEEARATVWEKTVALLRAVDERNKAATAGRSA